MAESAPSPILDIRAEDLFVAAHAPGAVNIPADELQARKHELPIRGVTIRLFDDDPGRLTRAAHILRDLGHPVEEVKLPAADLVESGKSLSVLWRPSPFLMEALDLLVAKGVSRPGRALDVACGSGREAVWLARRGYQVDAIDVLPDALARAADLARRNGAALHTIQQDLKRRPSLPEAPYDLVAVFRFLHRPLLPAIGQGIAPGGFLVYETFHWQDVGRGGRPPKPAHALRDGELAAAFAGLEVLIACDGVLRDGRRFCQLLARQAPR